MVNQHCIFCHILPVVSKLKLTEQQARPPFIRHFILKINILPRQARDKHRENSKKARFVEGRELPRAGWQA